MTRKISVTEAKAKLSALMDWVVKNKGEVIIQSRGKVKAAIISYEAYKQLIDLKEQARRKEALTQLEALATQIQGRNQDLTEETAVALADRFTREVVLALSHAHERGILHRDISSRNVMLRMDGRAVAACGRLSRNVAP